MIRQFVPSKSCLACLGCCRFSEKDSLWQPHLLKQEEKSLKAIKLVESSAQANYRCLFLNSENNKCVVYRKRPFECRLYPFLFNRRGKKIFLAVDLNCPYACAQQKTGKFKKYLKYLDKLFRSGKFLNILLRNPQLAQEYPGVTDIAEIK